jgi:hypothetical protein
MMTTARVDEAFERAWLMLEDRIADKTTVRERLARLIVTFGRHHPELSADELARTVVKMFNVSVDEESEPKSE